MKSDSEKIHIFALYFVKSKVGLFITIKTDFNGYIR